MLVEVEERRGKEQGAVEVAFLDVDLAQSIEHEHCKGMASVNLVGRGCMPRRGRRRCVAGACETIELQQPTLVIVQCAIEHPPLFEDASDGVENEHAELDGQVALGQASEVDCLLAVALCRGEVDVTAVEGEQRVFGVHGSEQARALGNRWQTSELIELGLKTKGCGQLVTEPIDVRRNELEIVGDGQQSLGSVRNGQQVSVRERLCGAITVAVAGEASEGLGSENDAGFLTELGEQTGAGSMETAGRESIELGGGEEGGGMIAEHGEQFETELQSPEGPGGGATAKQHVEKADDGAVQLGERPCSAHAASQDSLGGAADHLSSEQMAKSEVLGDGTHDAQVPAVDACRVHAIRQVHAVDGHEFPSLQTIDEGRQTGAAQLERGGTHGGVVQLEVQSTKSRERIR